MGEMPKNRGHVSKPPQGETLVEGFTTGFECQGLRRQPTPPEGMVTQNVPALWIMPFLLPGGKREMSTPNFRVLE